MFDNRAPLFRRLLEQLLALLDSTNHNVLAKTRQQIYKIMAARPESTLEYLHSRRFDCSAQQGKELDIVLPDRFVPRIASLIDQAMQRKYALDLHLGNSTTAEELAQLRSQLQAIQEQLQNEGLNPADYGLPGYVMQLLNP